MDEQARSAMRRNSYATCQDFLRIFDEDMRGLYQLSFLLTGDPEKGERCFVTGMEDCAKENRVFREWARLWAKRVIVQCVLERYREHECALLLNCSASEVREARAQAIEELADFRSSVFDVHGDCGREWSEALRA
jgi:hypothetical protein